MGLSCVCSYSLVGLGATGVDLFGLTKPESTEVLSLQK